MKAADVPMRRFIASVGDLPRNLPVIAAVSGGCDSIVMLDLLLRAKFDGIVVAHFNHGLRGRDADADAAFVLDFARRHKLPFVLGRGNTRHRAARHRESIEEAARNLRRAFLLRTARKHGAGTIFLGHNAGDAAETLLFHLVRGSGSRGLGSMRPRTSVGGIRLVRPLLGFTRNEIEAFASTHSLDFRQDTSNASREHTRNRLRLDILPLLSQAVGFDSIPALARTADILSAEDEWMNALIAEDASHSTLSTRALAAMPIARQRRVLQAWLSRLTQSPLDFATLERARLMALSSSPPAKTNLPANHHLRRRAGQLFVECSAGKLRCGSKKTMGVHQPSFRT